MCYDCPAGTFTEGGEPACVPCKPGYQNKLEAQSECLPCFEGMYSGTGFEACRKCGMFDKMQVTAPQGVGVECQLGKLNGTTPGYWAAYPLTLESTNWTRIWKCRKPALEVRFVSGRDSP